MIKWYDHMISSSPVEQFRLTRASSYAVYPTWDNLTVVVGPFRTLVAKKGKIRMLVKNLKIAKKMMIKL